MRDSALVWPLEPPIHLVPGLITPAWQGSGALFAGEEAALLRKVRERSSRMVLVEDLTARSSFVTDCGETYQLELRDLLPDATAAQLRRFMSEGWERPKLVSCGPTNNIRADCPIW